MAVRLSSSDRIRHLSAFNKMSRKITVEVTRQNLLRMMMMMIMSQ